MQLDFHYQLQDRESPLLVLLTLSHVFILFFSKMDVIFFYKKIKFIVKFSFGRFFL